LLRSVATAGRSRDRSGYRRTDRILDAALDLLREDPDADLTVERIVDRAKVSAATVFNLMCNREQLWSAMADRALEGLHVESITANDPHERAHRIVDAVVRIFRSDAAVFRALLSGGSSNGHVLAHDLTNALIECLRDAADAGHLRVAVNLRRYAEVMSAALIGTIQQWTAGLLDDRAFGIQARAVVDVVFAAAEA
jgi:AcrR family transcriptional regulator